jgi:hypothetical protein
MRSELARGTPSNGGDGFTLEGDALRALYGHDAGMNMQHAPDLDQVDMHLRQITELGYLLGQPDAQGRDTEALLELITELADHTRMMLREIRAGAETLPCS